MAIWPEAMSAIMVGMKRGDTHFPVGSSRRLFTLATITSKPPTPEDTMVPSSSGAMFSPLTRPLSRMACTAAAIA